MLQILSPIQRCRGVSCSYFIVTLQIGGLSIWDDIAGKKVDIYKVLYFLNYQVMQIEMLSTGKVKKTVYSTLQLDKLERFKRGEYV